MKSLRLFIALLRWDVLRELRRRDTVANMVLFALLILFLGEIGIGPDRAAIAAMGPIVFWIAVLFAGTVGVSQTFAAEREGNVIGAILTAPVDRGVFYLAKVAATWAYVLVMEAAAVLIYAVLYNAAPWERIHALFAVLAVFTAAYMAVGVVLAAMTTTLRGGGEVVLRILLFPLMIPMIWLTLRVSETVFDTVLAGGSLGTALPLGSYLAAALALDAIYLTAGFLLFPKVLEE